MAVRARRGWWQVRAMAEMWLGVLLILGIDFVLVGLVCAIVFVATTEIYTILFVGSVRCV